MNLITPYLTKPFLRDSPTALAYLRGRRLRAGIVSYAGTTLTLLIVSFFLFPYADAFASNSSSLSSPFTTKLADLSQHLVLIGKAIVGVSVLIGILMSAFGDPKWKLIITGIVVGIAIIGYVHIKNFIGLGG